MNVALSRRGQITYFYRPRPQLFSIIIISKNDSRKRERNWRKIGKRETKSVRYWEQKREEENKEKKKKEETDKGKRKGKEKKKTEKNRKLME